MSGASAAARFAVLDVGHGSCALVEEGGRGALIDCGPGPAVLEFLVQEGIKKLTTVAISHADADHVRGLIAILASNEVEVDRVYLNSDALKGSDLWSALLYELDDQHRAGKLVFETHLVEGDALDSSVPDVEMEVLAPRRRLTGLGPGSADRQGKSLESNSLSAVVRISYRGVPVALVGGDIDEVGLEHMLDSGVDCKASVLVFPHHGGRVSRNALPGDNARFARRLYEAVEPSTVVFSIGRGQHGTPRPEVVEALLSCDPALRIACTQLSQRCAASLPGQELSHLLPMFAVGRRERRCCAGTVQLLMETGNQSLAPYEEHQRFIDAAAPTALCRLRHLP